LPDQTALARVGFDKDIVAKYKGAYLFLVRGRPAGDTWTYTFESPAGQSIDFALVIQNGERRGGVVVSWP
ncbi:MAG: hypothetical protein ABIH23_10035, partial [bacterium]